MVTERQTPNGPIMSLSRPLVAAPECLVCHSTPANAPSAMIDTYGSANGFGWQPNETVGAQIVSVPLSLPLARAEEAVVHLLLTCGTVFLAVLAVPQPLSLLPCRQADPGHGEDRQRCQPGQAGHAGIRAPGQRRDRDPQPVVQSDASQTGRCPSTDRRHMTALPENPHGEGSIVDGTAL